MASAREEIRIGDHFCIGDKIGRGSFGDVFEGKCLKTGKYVAIKVEPTTAKFPLLMHESRIYKTLNQNRCPGVPRLHWCGTQGSYNIMITDMLGSSLEHMFALCDGQFTLRTTLLLAEQLLTRIEYIHSLGILHRDIKPENILLGPGDNTQEVYFIDFGLSKRYLHPKTKEHVPINVNRPLVGTARYASINSHLGFEQSRRDDLESIGYLLVYFMCGRLPWQGLPSNDNDPNYSTIGEKKLDTTLDELCEGLPCEFIDYLYTVRTLGYDEDPDYESLRNLFRAVARRQGYSENEGFDWISLSFSSEDGLSCEEEDLLSD